MLPEGPPSTHKLARSPHTSTVPPNRPITNQYLISGPRLQRLTFPSASRCFPCNLRLYSFAIPRQNVFRNGIRRLNHPPKTRPSRAKRASLPRSRVPTQRPQTRLRSSHSPHTAQLLALAFRTRQTCPTAASTFAPSQPYTATKEVVRGFTCAFQAFIQGYT